MQRLERLWQRGQPRLLYSSRAPHIAIDRLRASCPHHVRALPEEETASSEAQERTKNLPALCSPRQIHEEAQGRVASRRPGTAHPSMAGECVLQGDRRDLRSIRIAYRRFVAQSCCSSAPPPQCEWLYRCPSVDWARCHQSCQPCGRFRRCREATSDASRCARKPKFGDFMAFCTSPRVGRPENAWAALCGQTRCLFESRNAPREGYWSFEAEFHERAQNLAGLNA